MESHSLFRPQAIAARRDAEDERFHIQTRWPTKLAALISSLSMLGLVIWASSATIPRVVEVKGVVSTSVKPSNVFGGRSGVVSKLFVSEGSRVKLGDRIAVIKTDSKVESGWLAQQKIELHKNQILNQAELLKQEIVKSKGDLARNRSDLLAADHELSIARSEIFVARGRVESQAKLVSMIVPLIDKGFISKVEMERRSQVLKQYELEALDFQRRVENALQTLARLGHDQARIKSEAAILVLRYDQEVANVALNLLALEGEQGYTITAPVSGIVGGLQASEGSVVTNGRPLLQIVAETATADARLFVPSRGSGALKQGGAVRVMFDAYPYERFGSFSGRIVSISNVAIAPDAIDAPFKIEEPVAIVRIALDDPFRSRRGVQPLRPGMTVSAVLTLERRSVLSWMLRPLLAGEQYL